MLPLLLVWPATAPDNQAGKVTCMGWALDVDPRSIIGKGYQFCVGQRRNLTVYAPGSFPIALIVAGQYNTRAEWFRFTSWNPE